MDTKPPHMVPNTTDRAVWMVSAVKPPNLTSEVDIVLIVFFPRALTNLCSTQAAQVLQGFTPNEALDATHAPCSTATLYQRIAAERVVIHGTVKDGTLQHLRQREIAISTNTVSNYSDVSTLTPPPQKKQRGTTNESSELIEGGDRQPWRLLQRHRLHHHPRNLLQNYPKVAPGGVSEIKPKQNQRSWVSLLSGGLFSCEVIFL